MHSSCSSCHFTYSLTCSSFRLNGPTWHLHCLFLCATLLIRLIQYLLWMLRVNLVYHKKVFSCFKALSSLRYPLSKAWTTSKAGGLSRLMKPLQYSENMLAFQREGLYITHAMSPLVVFILKFFQILFLFPDLPQINERI